QTTRELFDTLLLWKARLPLDANGEASVEVPLNDSITSFRIVAVATDGAGLFGTGSASIQSTQELMVLSGLPPLVREGDRYRAGFTVRNTTNRNMEVDVSGKADSTSAGLKPIALSLSPGEAKEIGWDVVAPAGVETVKWEVEAKERGKEEHDRIRITQKVVPAVPVSTFQATLAQVENEFRLPVERPKDALPGRGGVRVVLRPKIAEGLSGVTDYMRRYPYTCMEQKVSRAIALKDDGLWKKVVEEIPSHMDSSGLVKYFPSMDLGSEVLTAYILSISNEAGREIPANLKEKMETGLKAFINGSVKRNPTLVAPDLTVRKLMAAEALSRHSGLDPRLLDSIMIQPNLWPTSAVLDWFNILIRSNDIPDRTKRLDEAAQIIRSRLNFQGSIMTFSTEGTDFLWWLMLSGDTNSVRLVLNMIDLEKWKEDMPRIIRGAIGRQYKGHWLTTTANAWGVLAVDKFAKKFEAAPVNGFTTASLSGADKEKTLDWAKEPKSGSLSFEWPKGEDTLHLIHVGQGRPWATVQSLAAIPLKGPLSSGYKIVKTITPVIQKEKGKWSVGDVARIKLELEAQSDMTWVVVNDPVPAGASILGIGLGRDSSLLTQAEEWKGYVWPAFEEKSFDSYKAYFEFVPKGKWQVEYTIRLNNEGKFLLPNTRVEALYAPEMFGENPNEELRIEL
ncbi:MAG TPA: hypothetical protein DCP92_16295, partial [Nitrospiraceae bacterium]|nr:hypothetical protein [Nitrospiraceae bacterium]